ncbi:MAG: protein kinase, partial [Gemmatimonadota bacterium]
LAASKAGDSRMTETGMSIGTPQYMSPEQAMGEREITARSDIYALGAVTYEMLIGEPPFSGPTAQAIVAKVLTEEPRPLIPRRRSISPDVEDGVLTALEKLPADRFTSAAEYAAALDGKADRQSSGRKARRAATTLPPYRGKTWVGAVLAMALLVAAALYAGTRLASGNSPIVTFGLSTKVTWDRGLEIQPALSPDGKYVAYAAGTTTSMRIFVRQVSGGRPIRLTDDSLEVQTNPSWSSDGSRILFLSGGGVFSAPSSGGAARPEMRAIPGKPITSAVWAPDGRTMGYAILDSVYLRDAGGAVRSLARVAEASLCQWSPRADFLACASGNSFYSRVGVFFGNLSPSRIVLVRVKDGATTTLTDSTSINQSPAWSPDAKWLYFISSRQGPRDIFALRIGSDGRAKGEATRLTTGLGAQSIAVSADGRRIAYAAYAGTSNVWSLPFPPGNTTEAAAVPVTSGSQNIEGGTPTADGNWFYYPSDVSGNSELYRIRLPHGEPEQLTNDPSDDFSPHLSPDGREVVFHSWRSGSRDLYLLPLDGGPVQSITATPAQEAAATWSPDGRALTFTTFGIPGSIWVVRRDAQGGWGKPVQLSAFGGWPEWSPDGRWIVFSSTQFGGGLFIVNPDSGMPRTILDSANAWGITAQMPHWSQDSRTIYSKSVDQSGYASFWAIPFSGGTPRLIIRFDDPTRPAYRPEWGIGGGRMFFAIQDRQSDIWVMETKQ